MTKEQQKEIDKRIQDFHERGDGFLDLSRLGITSLPKELQTLSSLRGLDLSNNILGSKEVAALSTLTKLQSLNLSGNSIGNSAVKALAGLTNLQSLDLSYNWLGESGAKALAGLTNLQSLDLCYNGLGESGAKALAGLTNLQSLDLSYNGLGEAGAKALAGLTNLQSLDLSYNGLGEAGVMALVGLSNLQNLYLQDNGLGDVGVIVLAGLTNLQRLNLSHNELGIRGAEVVAGLLSLQKLNLSHNFLRDSGAKMISCLANLHYLDLSYTELAVTGAQALGTLTGMQNLHLSNNKLGDEGLRALSGLTNLQSLNLSDVGLRDTGAHVLTGFTNLHSLNLSGNEIGVAVTKAIATLNKLKNLDLSRTGIRGVWMYALATLTNLQSLNLNENWIEDAGAVALAALTNLQNLNLSGTALSDSGAESLTALINLQSLDLSQNWLGTKGAYAVATLANLQTLDLRQNQVGDTGIKVLVTYLKSLESIDVTGNKTETIPEALLNNLAELKEYFNVSEKILLTPNTIAKIILTGNPSTGKSTLAEWLKNSSYTKKNSQTHGMQVWDWKEGKNTYRLWDFGGQDYYHATHALFMTDATLHLCLHTNIEAEKTEERLEDVQFDPPYWLGNIQYYTPSSKKKTPPVWFINTKSDVEGFKEHWLNRDEREEGVVSKLCSISVQEGEASQELLGFKQALEEALKAHMGKEELLPAWVQIRDEFLPKLRKEGIWYIKEREFRKACLNLIKERHEANAEEMLSYEGMMLIFESTGEIIKLKSNEAVQSIFSDLIFLSPEVLVNKIYQVLSIETKGNGGKLEVKGMDGVPKKDVEIIVEVLKQYDLIFKNPKAKGAHEEYIVPQYLSNDVHADHFARLIPLNLVIYYTGYMPLSLIPSFITRFASSDEDAFYWKYGAFFFFPPGKEAADRVSCFVRIDSVRRNVYIHLENKRNRLAALEKIIRHFFIRPEKYMICEEIPLADMLIKNFNDSDKDNPDGKHLIPNIAVSTDGSHLGRVDIIYKAIRANSLHFTSLESTFVPLQPIYYHLFGGKEFAMPKNIFLSYAHQDEASKEQLDRHFEALRKSGKVDTWQDRRINPGDKFDPTIQAALEKADIFLLLISVDFMNSKYIWNEEIKHAVENKKTIVPIFLHPCDFVETQFGISDYQGVPRDKNGHGIRWIHSSHWQYPHEAYLEVVNEIKKLL